MDESWKHDAKRKQSKKITYWKNSFVSSVHNKQIYIDRKQISGYQGVCH